MGREPPPLTEIKIDQTVPVRRPNIFPPTPSHAFVRWTSWLVPVIVAANCVVFLATMYVNDCPKNSGGCLLPSLGRFSFQPRSENVLIGPSSTTLDKMGALDATKVVHGHQGWRLLTCSWLHAGILHILANMVGLLCIGIRLEWDFGFVRIGLIYLISGFGGSLMSVFFLRSSISVGASGALFGLLGSMLSDLLINWTIYANKIVALLTLVFFIAINLAIGFLPHVDNFAHFGGSISGFLLGFVLLIRPQFEWLSRIRAPGNHTGPVKPKHTMIQYILWTVSAILLIVGFTVGLLMLFRRFDASGRCSWCH